MFLNAQIRRSTFGILNTGNCLAVFLMTTAWSAVQVAAQGTPDGCCLPNGSCQNLGQAHCAAAGGTFLGVGVPCGPPEACCFNDGSCMMLDAHCCAVLGGTALGSSTFCMGDLDGDGRDDACPQNPDCIVQPGVNACPNTQCPVFGDFCRPVEIVHDPVTGTYQITKCDCIWDGDCHIDILPGMTEPVCLKQCPNNLDCALTSIQNSDGTVTMKCDCYPMCEPLPAPQFGCTPITCPNTGEICRPVEIKYDPTTGAYVVAKCDCKRGNECHVEFDPASPVGPHCVGICPPGQDCVFNTVDHSDGTISYFCDCQGVPACGACCGGKPSYTGFPGTIAFITLDRGLPGDYVVSAIDLSNQGAAPIGSPDWVTPFYNHPTWRKSSLGSVFGLTIDHLGNVYVGHTAIYGLSFGIYSDAIGTLPGAAPGAIYRINTATGVASTWAVLPNTLDTSITPASEAWPGLGNLAFNCPVQRLYASNFSDGRIYNLNTAGTILSSYDHATGIVYPGSLSDPNDNPNSFAPLGERVWAVQPSQGRLYYSIWWEDQGRPNPSQQNEIWSIGLTGTGDFVAGSAQLEITLPSLYSGGGWSNPVSDITFTPNCCMILTERSMDTDTTSWAHQSRALEYCHTLSAGWVPSGNSFQIGAGGLNSAGGVDFDYDAASSVVDVWVTGDYLITYGSGPAWVYGLQGLPAAGGNVTNSIHIDSDQNTAFQDKFQQGDVEITCPSCINQTLAACCLPFFQCQDLDPLCCQQQGGTPGPAGTLCSQPEECCFPNGTNQIMDPACCVAAGGTPQGPGSGGIALAPGACCLPVGDPLGPCAFINPLCCQSRGGTFLGAHVLCTDNDANGNGLNDSCEPACEPLPSGFGCYDPVCPPPPFGEKCRPSQVTCAGGHCIVTDCDCLGVDECKLRQNGPGQFYCEGVCLSNPALRCELVTVHDAVGTRYYCDCVNVVPEACCLPDGTCTMVPASDCQALGGVPLGIGVMCKGIEACCYTNAVGQLVCQDMDKMCCQKLYHGAPQGTGSSCQGDNNGNGIDDECEPPGCEPPPPGVFACPSVQCPQQGDRCQPRCIDFDSNTGTFLVGECDCRRPGECHAELGPVMPMCVGPCPANHVCEQTIIQIAPGVERYCCDCREAVDECEPNISRTACRPHDCPIDGEVCIPRCLLFDGFNTYVEDCECRRQEECHPVPSTIVTPLAPSCEGFCPPGYNCIETVTTDGLPPGLSRICCECEPLCPLPDPTVPDDPCAYFQPTDCKSTSTNTQCTPDCVRIGPGPLDGPYPYVTACTCTNPGTCGPVTLTPIAGTFDYTLSCHGDCVPPQRGVCQIEINGGLTGMTSVLSSDLNMFDIVKCACGDLPIEVCPTPLPAAVDICGIRQPFDCADGSADDLCFPTKVQWNPATGQVTALSCECMPDTHCHVNPGFAGTPPSCVGTCPSTGEKCTPTMVPTANGFEFSCDCCPPNDVSINITTGVTPSNAFIPVGNNDDTWTVTSAPIGTPPYAPKVINPHPAWFTIPGSQWISANATGPNGVYIYEYCFCLAETYQNAYLTFEMRADDKAALYFNGNFVIATPSSYSFNSIPPTGVSLIGYFQPGTNCIQVVVENTHGVVTGLNLKGEVFAEDAECCCEPSPNALECKPTTCPNPNEICRPSKIECIPGALCRVVACDCMGPNECHATLNAAGLAQCTGGCPFFGQSCQRIDTPTGGTITTECRCGIPCNVISDCKSDTLGRNADNACNCMTCAGGECVYTCTTFGNVNCGANHVVNLDDILCVLAGFGGFAACPNGDIHPCAGNGLINLDDILGVLGAFAGSNPCGCNPAGEAPRCGSLAP